MSYLYYKSIKIKEKMKPISFYYIENLYSSDIQDLVIEYLDSYSNNYKDLYNNEKPLKYTYM